MLVTDNGLSKLDVGTMTFANFSRDDGLPFTQFYWNGIHYSPKRDLIFLATNAGMLVVHAEDKAMAGVKPVVKLSSLTIAGNAVYPSSGDYLEESIQQASSITLHEKDSRFTLELTTCNYGNNTRIRFAYRMKDTKKNGTKRSRAITSCGIRLFLQADISFRFGLPTRQDAGRTS